MSRKSKKNVVIRREACWICMERRIMCRSPMSLGLGRAEVEGGVLVWVGSELQRRGRRLGGHLQG
jgi:hypothetical protein